MSTCVTTASPLPYPMTFGKGAALQVPENADGGDEIVFYIQRLTGIKVG